MAAARARRLPPPPPTLYSTTLKSPTVVYNTVVMNLSRPVRPPCDVSDIIIVIFVA